LTPLALENESPAASKDRLGLLVDACLVQAVGAARHLVRLYRVLGDDKQAATALRMMAPLQARIQRKGLEAQTTALRENLLQDYPQETQAEEAAWRFFLEACAGFLAFHAAVAMGTPGTPGKDPLRGSRNEALRAFREGIKGFRTAFPEAMVQDGVSWAIDSASQVCAETIVGDFTEGETETSESTIRSIKQDIQDALSSAAT